MRRLLLRFTAQANEPSAENGIEESKTAAALPHPLNIGRAPGLARAVVGVALCCGHERIENADVLLAPRGQFGSCRFDVGLCGGVLGNGSILLKSAFLTFL